MAMLAIRTCKAADGIAWLRAGLRLFGRSPLLLAVLTALGPMTVLSLSLVPYVGTAAALMAVPFVSVGMLAVCRTVDTGGVPTLAEYAAALRDPAARVALLRIGIFYAIATGMLMTWWTLAAPEWMNPPAPAAADAPPPAPAPEVPLHWPVLLGSLLVWVPLQMATWLSPLLAAWHGMPAGKALFFSFFACWRNRWPLLLFLAGMAGLVFVLVMTFSALLGLLGAKADVAQYLLLPLPFLAVGIAQASTLSAYRGIVDDGHGS